MRISTAVFAVENTIASVARTTVKGVKNLNTHARAVAYDRAVAIQSWRIKRAARLLADAYAAAALSKDTV